MAELSRPAIPSERRPEDRNVSTGQLKEQFAEGHLPPAHTRSYTGHNLVQDKPLVGPAP
jgi:hypothetical protein